VPTIPATPPVVVLDTHLVLSALVFAGGRLAALHMAWQSGRCVPLISQATASQSEFGRRIVVAQVFLENLGSP